MIKVNIGEVATERGIKTAYQLQKLMNLPPALASKWYRNDLKMIGIESLNSLCEALDCLPSDLLVYSSGREKVEKPARKPKAVKTMASVEGLLNTNQVAERLGLSRKRVNDYINDGKLKAVKKKQNHNFVSESDLQEFIANRSGQVS
jgi:DNA-binding Xre family transcriptional regulator/predicted DNA-binding transcriptional regulator AlpA